MGRYREPRSIRGLGRLRRYEVVLMESTGLSFRNGNREDWIGWVRIVSMMEALKILRSPGLREVRRHDRNGPYLN